MKSNAISALDPWPKRLNLNNSYHSILVLTDVYLFISFVCSVHHICPPDLPVWVADRCAGGWSVDVHPAHNSEPVIPVRGLVKETNTTMTPVLAGQWTV